MKREDYQSGAFPWRVSANTPANFLADVIAKFATEQRSTIRLQAMGASATNQAIKSIIIARSYLALHRAGIDLVAIPEFIDVARENDTRTAISITINIVRAVP